MRARLLGLLLGVFLAGVVSQASATVLTYTFTGTLSGDYTDGAGIFGTPGTISEGTPFTAVESFDLTSAVFSDDASTTAYFGGSRNSLPPFGTASVTINGATTTFAGTYFGNIQFNKGVSTLNLQIIDSGVLFPSNLGFIVPLPFLPLTDTVIELNNAGAGNITAGDPAAFTSIGFFPERLVVSTGVTPPPVVSPVPLPASAPMFGAALLALGAVGYGMKRRQA